MHQLQKIHEQTSDKMEEIFSNIRTLLDSAHRRIRLITGIEESFVAFPEEFPLLVVTSKGVRRLEPLAYMTLRYCCFVYQVENRNRITFEEIGEKIYNNQFKPRSTIQNTVSRGETVNEIGITYYYNGESIFIRY